MAATPSIRSFPRKGNPHYPLPPDYPNLTSEGQRQARVNAARLWLIGSTPAERAYNLMISTAFFDRFYLHPRPDINFDPMFYDMDPLPTPEVHWTMSRMWAMHRLNLIIAPRGSAKSTHCRKDMILRMVTCPKYSFVYATSTNENAILTGQILRDQGYNNPLIQKDFAPEYGLLTLKPARGQMPTGVEHFYLANYSYSRQVSAESRLRGLRPRRFRLDDPEYDAKASTSMSTYRDYMETLIHKIAIPMVMRAKCGIDWTATFVSRRHFAWKAYQTIETPEGRVAELPEYNHWARLFIPVRIDEEQEDGTIVQRSAWPEMWPLTIKEKEALNLDPETVSIEEMIQIMGPSSFNSEMMGRPGDGDSQFFTLDETRDGSHAWWIENADSALRDRPFESLSLICYRDPKDPDSIVRTPLGEFLRNVRLFMTVDTAFTEKSHSDRRCAMLMAVNRENILFALDLWSGRKSDSELMKRAFSMAQKWHCPTIGVEVVKESFKLYQRMRSAVRTGLTTTMGIEYAPTIRDLKPGHHTKQSKIETLDVRFEYGLIKLPLFMKAAGGPWWSRLFEQIASFNPEATDGGLEHDDELDCLSMSGLMIRGKLRKYAEGLSDESPDELSIDAVEQLSSGKRFTEHGVDLLSAIDWAKIPIEQLTPIMESLGLTKARSSGETRA